MQRTITLSILTLVWGLSTGAQARWDEGDDHGDRQARNEQGAPSASAARPQGLGHQNRPAQTPHHSHPHPQGQAASRHSASRPGQASASFAGVRASTAAVPHRWQGLGVQHVPTPWRRQQLLSTPAARSSIALPSRGPGGGVLSASAFSRGQMNSASVHANLRLVAQNGALTASIGRYNLSERVAGQYYWHRWNGHDYCHYYDRWGYHWYGWYLGDQCFWVRNYNGAWWWDDPLQNRWCYWYDGFWWWQDPLNQGATYIYNGSDYVSSDSADAGTVPTLPNGPSDAGAPQAPPAAVPGLMVPAVTPLPAAPGEVVPSVPAQP
jgi:hypothetical protein